MITPGGHKPLISDRLGAADVCVASALYLAFQHLALPALPHTKRWLQTVMQHACFGDLKFALAAAPQVDILINNAGGPPPGDFRDWDREAWIKAIDGNMLTPIELIKATVDGMAARGFGRIVNITSSAVKAPIDILGLSNGARSGLTGFVAGVARSPQLVSSNVTINNLLPGTFDTARLAGNFAAQAQREGRTVEEVRSTRLAKHPAHRLGQPSELGATCAFLCSVHAGYINGQNVLLDGGSFAGV